jgi:hypothetical protein
MKTLITCFILAGLVPTSIELDTHRAPILNKKNAADFLALSLKCVDQEYPNKPGNVVDGDQTVLPPRKLTPAFFGCFDWHSAVHGHWALVRIMKLFPKLKTEEIIDKLDRHLTPNKIAAELAYFKEPRNKTFERPYGWGWLLRLAAELKELENKNAPRWSQALEPLVNLIADMSIDYLERLSTPVREGTHANTAFAMAHMFDYAQIANNVRLLEIVKKRALDFFFNDRECPTDYEPSGEDFISPCLVEADLLRRVLPQKKYTAWLNQFLPPISSYKFSTFHNPIEIRDLKDPKIGHLIGLAFQRAWCFLGIASTLDKSDPNKSIFLKLAYNHQRQALRQMFDSGYGGEHWLASFAIYSLSGVGL